MSISLYYTAKREQPMSKQEHDSCMKTVERFIQDYSLDEMYEGFCVYDSDKKSIKENIIFDGATKLPIDDGEEYFTEVLNYWTECLQEIIDLLPEAEWNIHIDDSDITQLFDFPV